MRVLCVGAGAVGGCVAARLQCAGSDPCVLDSNDEHVRLLNDPGLIVDGLDGGKITRLRTSCDGDGEADVVLLAVRSHATEDALSSIASHVGPKTDVVSLQNGLNEDRISSVVGPEATVGCVVGFGATWIEPGRIELNATGELVIGRLDGHLDGRGDDRLVAIRDLLSAAFPTRISDNIRGALWAKMLVNSMTVLGALGGMLTGDLLETLERRRIVADVIAEGVRVARDEHVTLPKVLGRVDADLVDDSGWHDAMDGALLRTAETFGAIKSVTWRDFEIGRPTEIDAVTGEIVRRGRRNRVPVPLSERVYEMLREIEAKTRQPDAANLDLLARQR